MVYGIWPHIGKNVKRATHKRNRTVQRSVGPEKTQDMKIDKYEDGGRDYMAPSDNRKSNREQMNKKKMERDIARTSKYNSYL